MKTLKDNIIPSDYVIGGTLLLTLIWNGTCSLLAPGWISASTITAINWLVFVFYVFSKGNTLVGKIMLFSIIAGFVELIADWWLVAVTGTLVYNAGGPFIVCSPLYMPFAWGVVLTQTSYIGWRLLNTFGFVPAVLFTGLLGAATIPFYELWANGAMWWHYKDCNMLAVVPYYIIAGEFQIASGLVFILYLLERGSLWRVLPFGIAQGLWIWASYLMSYSILG